MRAASLKCFWQPFSRSKTRGSWLKRASSVIGPPFSRWAVVHQKWYLEEDFRCCQNLPGQSDFTWRWYLQPVGVRKCFHVFLIWTLVIGFHCICPCPWDWRPSDDTVGISNPFIIASCLSFVKRQRFDVAPQWIHCSTPCGLQWLQIRL